METEKSIQIKTGHLDNSVTNGNQKRRKKNRGAKNQSSSSPVGSENDKPTLGDRLEDLKQWMTAEFHRNASETEQALQAKEIELARREERLEGRRRSLVQRFKAERVELRQERELLNNEKRAPVESETDSDSELRTQRSIAELKKSLDDAYLENEQLVEENRSLRQDLSRESQNPSDELSQLRTQLESLRTELVNANNKLALQNSGVNSSDDNSWESQKKRMLISLEGGDTENEASSGTSSQRPSGQIDALLENVRQLQDEKSELAKKVDQLQALLDAELQGDACHTDHQDVFDQDEIIRKQREKLKKLEDEWRQKIGEAEIELSKERAKLSRDRQVLDREVQDFEFRMKTTPIPEAKPQKAKWRERLGL